MTDKVFWEKAEGDRPEYLPSMEIIKADGTPSGMVFHGVPGGHEINSFVIGLYNAAGPGTAVTQEEKERIGRISRQTDIEIMVSLSCTMCPELVMAAQKIAALSDRVRAEVYDLSHYPELKEKYQIMSVPCMVVNKEQVFFGKKNVGELLDILEDPNQ